MRAPLALLLAALLLPTPTLANDYELGLVAELEQENPTLALKHYARAQRSATPQARDATLRRLWIWVARKDLKHVERELAFLKTFPQALGTDVLELDTDPAAWLKKNRLPKTVDSAWRGKIQRALKRRATLKFDETPILEVIDFLRDILSINIVAFPDIPEDLEISCQLKNVTVENALQVVLGGSGLNWSVRHGALVISKRAKPSFPVFTGRDLAALPKYYQLLRSRTVNLNFPDTPLTELVTFLQDITGLNITLVPDFDPEDLNITLRVKDISLLHALRLTLATQGLSMAMKHETLLIGKKPRAFPFATIPAGVRKVSPENQHAALQLARRKVRLNFDETPLQEAIDFLRDITGLNFVVLPGVDGDTEVSLHLKDISLEAALPLILASSRAKLTVHAGVIVIGKDLGTLAGARPKKLPDNRAAKLLRSRSVTLHFSETPLNEVVTFLQDLTGLSWSLAPGVKPDQVVSLSLKKVRMGDAVTLIAAKLKLRYRFDGEALVLEPQPRK